MTVSAKVRSHEGSSSVYAIPDTRFNLTYVAQPSEIIIFQFSKLITSQEPVEWYFI